MQVVRMMMMISNLHLCFLQRGHTLPVSVSHEWISSSRHTNHTACCCNPYSISSCVASFKICQRAETEYVCEPVSALILTPMSWGISALIKSGTFIAQIVSRDTSVWHLSTTDVVTRSANTDIYHCINIRLTQNTALFFGCRLWESKPTKSLSILSANLLSLSSEHTLNLIIHLQREL